MKYLFIILYATIFLPLKAQETFSKRYFFDRPAALCSCISITDTAYYAVGVTNDTLPPFTAGNFFAKIRLDGEIDFVEIYTDTTKTLEVWSEHLIKTDDNGFAAVGYSFDDDMSAFLIKYNNQGDTIFTSFFRNSFYPTEIFILPRHLVQSEDKGYVISEWFEKPNGNNGNSEFGLTKMDSTGQIEWRQYYADELSDQPRSMIVDNDGNYVIGSWNQNLSTQNMWFDSHARITKIDPLGNLISDYKTPEEWGLIGHADGLVATADGGLIVASRKGIEMDFPSVNDVFWHTYIFKLNSDMEFVWGADIRSSLIAPFNLFNRLIDLEDGSGFVAAGRVHDSTYVENIYGAKGQIAKISPDGDSLWHRLYHIVDSPSNTNVFNDLKQTPDGGFLLCGEANGFIQPDLEDYPRQRAWLMKLDQHGCLVPGCHLIDDVVEEPNTQSILLYPNPVTDYLNIYVGSNILTKKLRFELTALDGRVVKSFSSPSSNITHLLPVYDVSSGMYVLSVYDVNKLIFSEQVVIGR